MQSLSQQQTRALVLDSLGVHRQLESIAETLTILRLFQIDSVNVFQRAHLMPAFSRLGDYDLAEFERLAFGGGDLPVFREYWAHCAAIIPAADWGLYEFRRAEYRSHERVQSALSSSNPMTKWILSELLNNGPMTISQFEHDANRRQGSWWGWSEVKTILERLFFAGAVVSAGRINFSRRYALPEQLELVGTGLTEQEQKLELIRRAATALGVATEADIADYFRFYKTEARPLIKQLVQAGELVEVKPEGWSSPGYAPVERLAREPKLVFDRPLRIFNPFDPLTWNRERTLRIFEFDYQIEIYTPEQKRRYGYYTLPILYRDQLVGRVDLKHERKQKALDVRSLWIEPWVGAELKSELTEELLSELQLLQNWIGAEKLIPPQKGNWAL